jgi:hypothetical protein
MMREVTVVDCSSDKRVFPSWLLADKPPNLSAERLEQIVWDDIAYALSRPVNPDEPPTEYAPTQILAEAFLAHGYDSIVYKSLFGKGLNIALFSCEAADLINCGLHETNAVTYTFDQCDNPYFVMKHYPETPEKDPVPINTENSVTTLFPYVVDHDLGFAPNPASGYCTLVNCKFRRPGERCNIVEYSDLRVCLVLSYRT